MSIDLKSNIENLFSKIKNILLNDRQKEYGDPNDNFQRVVDYWNVYLNNKVKVNGNFYLHKKDIAIMMVLFKIARLENNNYKEDTTLDILGYSILSDLFSKDEVSSEISNEE